jgi:elongator complex protein 6
LPLREVVASSSAPPRRPTQPIRRHVLPTKSSIIPRAGIAIPPPTSPDIPAASTGDQPDKLSSTNPSHNLDSIQKGIDFVTKDQEGKKVLLILDAPDILLALQPTERNHPMSSSTSLQSLILSLRLQEAVHSIVLNVSADVSPPASTLPSNHMLSSLESENQALLIGLAHQAELIISCRGLDTGGAGDVSGIMRITKGAEDQEDINEAYKQEWKEQELLYLVRNDGTAKVWERGAGVG